MMRAGRRVATPSLELGRSTSREEVLEDLSSPQEQPILTVKMRCKQPLGQRAGLENVAPEASQGPAKLPSPGKLNLSSPNKENEEALNFFQETSQNTFPKRKLMEKEVPEEQMLVEALRTAATGQSFAALCGLRKALARPRPAIQGVLRCGGAELLVATLRSTNLSSAGKAEAAWCLVQLASGSSAQTKQLVQAGACAAALEVLQLHSAESSQLCDFLLQLLANVGGDVDCSFRDGLLDSDIVNILGHLFAKMPDFTWTNLERCEVLRSFTWLMATLCRGTTAPKLEKVDCAFDFFAQVLHGTADAEMLSNALWGLCYLLEAKEDTDRCLRAARMLSAGFDELSQAPEPHPLLQQVVHCLRSPGDWRCPLPSAALRLAGILVELSEPSFTDALLSAGLLGALHADLVDAYAPLQVRRDAAWVLANVAAGNLAQAQRLAEQPGLAEALCDQQTKEVAQECSWAILNLLKHGPDMFTRLGIHRVLGVLLNALHSEAEASLQQAAMEQLELLMQQLTPEASGLVAKLQVLSRSPDKAVLSKAQFLLRNFFPHGSAGNTKEGSSLGCSK